jgi:hypothetical protein
MVVEDVEVALVQIAHKLAMLVHGNKKNVDLVNSFLDGENGILIVSRPRGAAGYVSVNRIVGSSYER